MPVSFRIVFLLILGLLLVGCGVEATPRPTFEPTATFVVVERPVELVADEPTDVPPTAVAEVLTEEPTEVVTEAPTEEPTPEPTVAEEPTEAPTEVAAAGPVVDTTGLPEGADPEVGEQLFNLLPNSETGQMCLTCHNPEEPIPGTGPYVYGIALVAGERVEGQNAVEYLYNSIVNPNSFIAPPQGDMVWVENVMPDNWLQELGEESVYHLVAYLLALTQAE